MTRVELFLALQDFGLSGAATKKLVDTGSFDAPFGELILEGHMLTVNRKSGEVVSYDLSEVDNSLS